LSSAFGGNDEDCDEDYDKDYRRWRQE